MKSLILSAVFCLLVPVGAQADLITIRTDAPPGTPLEMIPGSISGSMLLNIFRDGTPAGPQDNLTGWQVTLNIVPVGSATGTITFNSAVEPPNYVFDSVSHPPITVNNSGNSLTAFNFTTTSGGVSVPAGAGVNLLDMNFSASPDASGQFNILAMDGPFQSEWTDNASPIQNSRQFTNLPGTGSGVAIGQINAVPEPGSLLLAGLAITGLGVARYARRRRRMISAGHQAVGEGLSV